MHTKLPIISFFQKLIIFFYCLIFKEFEKKFLNQEFYGQLPEQAWSKGSFDFSKIMLLRAPKSLIQMVSKWKGSVYRDGFITNSNHQFFPDPKSNVWKKNFIFIFFQWLYDHENYSFLETLARFLMTKTLKTSLFISCKCWHQSSVYIFSKSTFTNENIHDQKTNKNCP